MRWRGLGRLLITLIGLTLIGMACARDDAGSAPDASPETRDEAPDDGREVALYFPGEDGRLHAESRLLPATDDPERDVRALLDALLVGPRAEGLWRPLEPAPLVDVDSEAAVSDTDPATGSANDVGEGDGESVARPAVLGPPPSGTVRLGPVYLLDDGTVVVDFEAQKPPAVGSREERLILFSLVNTVLLNTPEAERLLFLWNGRQPTTFAGHLDTGTALVPNRGLIGEPIS